MDEELDAVDAADTADGEGYDAKAELEALAAQLPVGQKAYERSEASAAEARKALSDARAKILARKFDTALPLLAISAGLGAPTRSGAFGESISNMSKALMEPVKDKQTFERQQMADLLGVDTGIAGVDEKAAAVGMQLAAIQGRLAAAQARVRGGSGLPMSWKEYKLWKTLPTPEARREYLELKRSPGLTIGDVNGVKSIIDPRAIIHPELTAVSPLTTLGKETNAQGALAESKEAGKGFGEQYNKIQQAGLDAAARQNNLLRMNQLLEGVNTGKLVPAMTQVAALAQSLGIPIDPKLGAKQALQSLLSEVALTMRNPAGGAGMPGSLSDTDRGFLQTMPAGLEKTQEGNRLIIETAAKLSQRDRDVYRRAREYRKVHGRIDEGFFDELDEWSEKNPLFSSPKIAPSEEADAAPVPQETAERTYPTPDRAALTYLKNNPSTKAFFKKTYGYLPPGY